MPAKAKGLDIKSLFRNKKEFSDDLSIDLGNGATLTLGELRAYDSELEGGLQAAMAEEKVKLERERTKINKAADEVANLYLSLEEEKKGLAKAKTSSSVSDDPFASDALQSDPLAKVVKGFMDEVRGALKSTNENIDKVSKNLTQAGRTYMNDLVRNQYDDLRKDADFSDEMTLDGVFDYAVKRGLKRDDGIPDVKEAYERMVQPKRQARLVKEAEERGYNKKVDEDKKAAFMPPPGSFGNGIGVRDKMSGDPKQAPRTIREAVARASTDPTIFGFKDSVN